MIKFLYFIIDQHQEQQEQQQEGPEQNLLQQFLQTLNNNSDSGENSDSTNPEEKLKNFLTETGKKSSNQAVKNFLENYGFEMVMQFNEHHQRKKARVHRSLCKLSC